MTYLACSRPLILWALCALACCSALAGPVVDRIKSAGTLRVCAWPAYFGITYRELASQKFTGLDVDMAQALARDLGVRLQWVDSSFATLIDDLVSDRCDVAMFGVAALPERMARLRFTQPYLKSDIYGITLKASHVIRGWEDIDKPGIRVAVQAGTSMALVMKEALTQARLVLVQSGQTREAELEAGRADVFMTDYPYSRRVLAHSDAFKLIRPTRVFFELPYAYAVKPGDEEWLARMDIFVSQIKRDGRLATAGAVHGLTDIVVGK